MLRVAETLRAKLHEPLGPPNLHAAIKPSGGDGGDDGLAPDTHSGRDYCDKRL